EGCRVGCREGCREGCRVGCREGCHSTNRRLSSKFCRRSCSANVRGRKGGVSTITVKPRSHDIPRIEGGMPKAVSDLIDAAIADGTHTRPVIELNTSGRYEGTRQPVATYFVRDETGKVYYNPPPLRVPRGGFQ